MSVDLQEEIIDISQTLTHLHGRLGELAKRITEEEHKKLRKLEDDNGRLRDDVYQLRTVNAKLRRQVIEQPELDQAVEARDGAMRKLRHARKVIRDLIEERENADASRSRTVSPAPSVVSMGSLKDIISSRSSTSSSSSSTGSTRTIRGGNRSRKGVPQKTVSPMALSTNGSPARQKEDRRADLPAYPTPSITDLNRSRTMSPSDSPTMSATPGSPTPSSRSDSEEVSIYFSRPPRTANLFRGPYRLHDLQQIFTLDNKALATLKRLGSDQQLKMRILTLGEVAFIYDPIFAELGQTSFLLDWGDQDSNEKIASHITGKAYHTFVFPTDKNKWYYIGALTWKPVGWTPIWPSLSQKARAEIVRKLKKRSGDDERVEERVTSGDAEQITFEISGHGHNQLSQDFATRLQSSN